MLVMLVQKAQKKLYQMVCSAQLKQLVIWAHHTHCMLNFSDSSYEEGDNSWI